MLVACERSTSFEEQELTASDGTKTVYLHMYEEGLAIHSSRQTGDDSTMIANIGECTDTVIGWSEENTLVIKGGEAFCGDLDTFQSKRSGIDLQLCFKRASCPKLVVSKPIPSCVVRRS